MNKKNITLILAGILILVLQFNIKIGPATVDIFSDIIANILIIVGILPLAQRNIMFKKSRNIIFLSLIFSFVGQGLNFVNWGESASEINTIVAAMSTVFTIYFTYYFTEAIVLEAKFQDKSATTRSFRVTWVIFGILVFVHYIAFMSNVSIAAILVQAVAVICGIYYCSTVLTACKQLYMEGLPTKHMENTKINSR